MGKKQNKPGPNLSVVPSLPQKDLYQRVNFALQASTFLNALPSNSDRKGKRKASSHYQDTTDHGDTGSEQAAVDVEGLAQTTLKTTKKMVAHTQLKLDPSIKRTICKQCNTLLIPGLTARIRNKPNRQSVNSTTITCLECSSTLRIPAPPVSISCDDIDGNVRRRRREKIIKRSKPAFHDRERTDDGRPGHTLWSDDKKVENWGEKPRIVFDTPHHHGQEE